jgi:hypothetical protein
MNEEQRVRSIRGVSSLEQLSSMRKNVIDRNGLPEGIDNAFRDREFELYQEKTAARLQRSLDVLSPLELKIIRGLAALWMTHEKHLPPNRSIQALRNRDGDLIKFAEDVVSSGTESSGYRRLKAAGFDDLVPVRPEQAAFRRALFERFDGRCALTGCAVAELLDAAHLPGREWVLGHNTADDGILLRTDLHRALDTGLIRLDDDLNIVWVDPCVLDLYGVLIRPT